MLLGFDCGASSENDVFFQIRMWRRRQGGWE